MRAPGASIRQDRIAHSALLVSAIAAVSRCPESRENFDFPMNTHPGSQRAIFALSSRLDPDRPPIGDVAEWSKAHPC